MPHRPASRNYRKWDDWIEDQKPELDFGDLVRTTDKLQRHYWRDPKTGRFAKPEVVAAEWQAATQTKDWSPSQQAHIRSYIEENV